MIGSPTTRPETKRALLNHVFNHGGLSLHETKNWSGLLNEANMYHVAEMIRQRFEGRQFNIASVLFADCSPDLNLKNNCKLAKPMWADRRPETIRVFEPNLICFSTGICFSKGEFLWTFEAAPGTSTVGDKFTNVGFTHDSMAFSQRHPSGHFNMYLFKLIQ